MPRKTLAGKASVCYNSGREISGREIFGCDAREGKRTVESRLSKNDAKIRFEGGCRADRGAVHAADLRGTWREMGRQYGALFQAELQHIVSFVNGIRTVSAENLAAAEEITCWRAGQMSYDIRQFLAGAAETSGLTQRELEYADAVEYIAGLPACSALAVWKDYAKDKLIFGRNYDYGEEFAALKNDVVITVFHPADGSLAAATVGYAGEIYAVNGMNERGIFLELNNGTPSTGMAQDRTRICGTSFLFDLLFRTEHLDYLDGFFRTVLCDDSYIINAADSREARSYEWSQGGMKRGDGLFPEGLMISTNHYQNPDWPYPQPDDAHSWASQTRARNLRKLAEENKAIMDVQRMEALLDIMLKDGGATDGFTVYQLTAVPEDMTLCLKVRGASDWVTVDLGSFFSSSGSPA